MKGLTKKKRFDVKITSTALVNDFMLSKVLTYLNPQPVINTIINNYEIIKEKVANKYTTIKSQMDITAIENKIRDVKNKIMNVRNIEL